MFANDKHTQFHIGNTAITVVKLAGMRGFHWQTHNYNDYMFEAPLHLHKLHRNIGLIVCCASLDAKTNAYVLVFVFQTWLGASIRHHSDAESEAVESDNSLVWWSPQLTWRVLTKWQTKQATLGPCSPAGHWLANCHSEPRASNRSHRGEGMYLVETPGPPVPIT